MYNCARNRYGTRHALLYCFEYHPSGFSEGPKLLRPYVHVLGQAG